jgi:hypothetical protein
MRDSDRRVRLPWDASRYAVLIRPIDRTDADALMAFYAGLSSASRRRRFLGSGAAPSLRQCRLLTEAPHGGFVAELRGSGPCDRDVIGHLCLEPLVKDREVMAVAVGDHYQHPHVGRPWFVPSFDRRAGAGFVNCAGSSPSETGRFLVSSGAFRAPDWR